MTHRTLAGLLLATLIALPAAAQSIPRSNTQSNAQSNPQPSRTPPAAPARSHRVLFGLTSADPIDWDLTLGNIQNLTRGFNPEPVEIEVVVYGPGIVFLKSDSTAANDIKAAQADHVRFAACANSMRARNLTQPELLPGAEVVPSGIIEVIRKQESGWTYIKAGR